MIDNGEGGKKLSNASMMPGERRGLSLNGCNKMLKLFDDGINEEVPWIETKPNWLMYRHPWGLCKCYIRGCGTNEVSLGINPTHEDAFTESDVKVVDNDTDLDIINKYGLQIGDRYVVCEKIIKLVPSGDEAINIPASGDNTHAWLVLWLRILCHEGMLHSPHSGMVLLYVDKHALYYDESLVMKRIHEIRTQLGNGGSQSYYSVKNDWHVCYDCDVDDGCDWAFLYKWLQRTLGPKSIYPNPETIRIDEHGRITCVKSSNKAQFECAMGEYIPAYTYDHISEAHKPGQVTFTSCSGVLQQHLGNQVECKLNEEIEEAYENGTQSKFTAEYMHERRKSIAKSLGHAFCYLTSPMKLVNHFEPCHFFWSWVMIILVIFVVLMFCVWEWPKEHILLVLTFINCLYILIQFEIWMDKNENRRMFKLPEIRSRGDSCKKIINGLPYAIVCAMHVAEWVEQECDESIEITMVILSVLYFTVVMMKTVFGILFKTRYYVFTIDGRLFLIEQMIAINKKVVYVVYNVCTVLVEWTSYNIHVHCVVCEFNV